MSVGHLYLILFLFSICCNVHGITSFKNSIKSHSVDRFNKWWNILYSNPTRIIAKNILKTEQINKSIPPPVIPIPIPVMSIAMKEHIRLILTLYGRNNSLVINPPNSDIDFEFESQSLQPYNLEELFEWTLKHCKYKYNNNNNNSNPIADCLLELFELAFQLTPSRFEVFINIYEKLLRYIRREVMYLQYNEEDSITTSNINNTRNAIVNRYVFDSPIDWTNCTLMDWFPAEYAIIYNITDIMKSYRFDLTQFFNEKNTTQIYKQNDIFEELKSAVYQEDSLKIQEICKSIYIPRNSNNPGFDSCLFIKPIMDSKSYKNMNMKNDESIKKRKNQIITQVHQKPPVIAILGEQKISTRKSKLYINIYKDIIKKYKLAMKQLNKHEHSVENESHIDMDTTNTTTIISVNNKIQMQKTPTESIFQPPSISSSNSSSTTALDFDFQWNLTNTIFIGHYLRRINPKLKNKYILKQYMKRYLIKPNIIIFDEEHIERWIGPVLYELLAIARGRSRKRAMDCYSMSSDLNEKDRYEKEMKIQKIQKKIQKIQKKNDDGYGNHENKIYKQDINKKLEIYIRKLLKAKYAYR